MKKLFLSKQLFISFLNTYALSDIRNIISNYDILLTDGLISGDAELNSKLQEILKKENYDSKN